MSIYNTQITGVIQVQGMQLENSSAHHQFNYFSAPDQIIQPESRCTTTEYPILVQSSDFKDKASSGKKFPPGLEDDTRQSTCDKENQEPNNTAFDLTPLKKLKHAPNQSRTKKKPNKKRSRIFVDSASELEEDNKEYTSEMTMNQSQLRHPETYVFESISGVKTEKKGVPRHESDESTSGDSEPGFCNSSNERGDTQLKILSMFLQDEEHTDEEEESDEGELSDCNEQQELAY